jgi:hypothetical protein
MLTEIHFTIFLLFGNTRCDMTFTIRQAVSVVDTQLPLYSKCQLVELNGRFGVQVMTKL